MSSASEHYLLHHGCCQHFQFTIQQQLIYCGYTHTGRIGYACYYEELTKVGSQWCTVRTLAISSQHIQDMFYFFLVSLLTYSFLHFGMSLSLTPKQV